jgi:hypothetical protein
MKDWKLTSAIVLTRQSNGRIQYRISPRELRYEGEVPEGGFLSNWCRSPEQAWQAAHRRRSHQICNSDFGEGY